ncbi:MAG: RNA-directed DNA polymerase [Betaproteobacteria bacterium]|nr:MAG: RNA-directed DNA polymerase [Betaproteobacteria bacterium]
MASRPISRPSLRLLHDRQAGRARAICSLVAPLAGSFGSATDLRTTDTDGQLDLFSAPARSGAVSRLSDRAGDASSATHGLALWPAPATPTTPGSRTSTTATRTTTTSPTNTERAPSAETPDGAFSYAALVDAWIDCRRTKRNTAAARAFEAEIEANLTRLYEALAAGTYRPGPSICFAITRPKLREVWAAAFADRVVHHLLYRHIGPRFERAFIADTCACIEVRGTLYAARRLENKVRAITHNWARRAYYLKLDLANFFPSIDKRVLREQLVARISESWWRSLAERILLHDPRPDVELRGDPQRLAAIPPQKSLLHQPAHLGLPIGNLSSQFFANVYLDALDQHVKHDLRARHYIRYVDDFILLHESPQQLNAWRADIEAFLPARLGVRLNPAKTVLQPIERGIDFVGQVIKPHRRTIRRRTFNAALHRIDRMRDDDLHRSANSYFGLLRQATHSHRDRARLANLVRRRGLAVDHNLTKAYA